MPEELLDATRNSDVVRVPPRTVIALDGSGPPEQEPFQRAVPALYAVGYGLRFAQKPHGRDFRIGPLEARWWAEPPPAGGAPPPRETWRWQLRLAIPGRIGADEIEAMAARKGAANPDALRVKRVFIDAQMAGRILHVGPYADEPRSLEAARAALVDAGLAPAGPHLEIYLSDPRRTAPEKLKTVLLVEPLCSSIL